MNARSLLTWSVAAIGCAASAALVGRHATPVDDALPFIAIVVTVVAAATHGAVLLAVPALLLGEIAVVDERLRLLWFGVVLAAVFAAAILWSAGDPARDAVPAREVGPPAGGRVRPRSAVLIALAAVLLLRWIPFDQVLIGRELLILAIAAATVIVLKGTPFAIAVAVLTALFTTAVPLRTLMIPMVVLLIAAMARLLGALRVRVPVLSAFAVGVAMTFFAWSGALARALPLMLRGGPPAIERAPVRIALAAGQWAEVEVPRGARGLILSGANVPRLKRGTVLGTIQPDGVVVRIGDVADWGALRRDQYYNSRNPLPRRPGGLLRGYGQTSWIDASGRVAVAPGLVTVTADSGLPSQASLQIDAIELGP